jgi:hypothetical protein
MVDDDEVAESRKRVRKRHDAFVDRVNRRAFFGGDFDPG